MEKVQIELVMKVSLKKLVKRYLGLLIMEKVEKGQVKLRLL